MNDLKTYKEYFKDEDWAIILYFALKQFGEEKGFKIPNQVSFHWLTDNFLDDFIKEKGLELHPYRTSNKVTYLGKQILEKGLFSFDNPEPKTFSNDYGVILKGIKKMIKLPEGMSISIEEVKPSVLSVNIQVDYPKFVTSDLSDTILENIGDDSVQHNLWRKVINLLENFYTIKIGNPLSGGLDVQSGRFDVENRTEAQRKIIKSLKQFFQNKSINDKIRGFKITSQSSDRSNLRTDIDILLKDPTDYERWSSRSREKLRNFMQELSPILNEFYAQENLNKKIIRFTSPTIRKVLGKWNSENYF